MFELVTTRNLIKHEIYKQLTIQELKELVILLHKPIHTNNYIFLITPNEVTELKEEWNYLKGLSVSYDLYILISKSWIPYLPDYIEELTLFDNYNEVIKELELSITDNIYYKLYSSISRYHLPLKETLMTLKKELGDYISDLDKVSEYVLIDDKPSTYLIYFKLMYKDDNIHKSLYNYSTYRSLNKRIVEGIKEKCNYLREGIEKNKYDKDISQSRMLEVYLNSLKGLYI